MIRRLIRCSVLMAIAVTLFQLSLRELQATPPWGSLVNFKKVDADPAKSYRLTKDEGPWMILAINFSGEDAMEEARALALEIRKQHKLEAYTHEKMFDFSETLIGKGFDKYGEPKRMRHNRDERIKEVAVLVGNFDSVDDPELERTLQRVKQMQPKLLGDKSIEQADQSLADNSLADFLVIQRKEASKQLQKGPLGMAFVAPNPLLPESYFRPGGVDKFVVDLNEGIKHSLLTNKAQYTIKVATFNGQAVVDPKDVQRIEQGGEMNSRLEEAALNAHRMCEALRAKGYDAYEFHERYASMVTIGGFDTIGMQDLNGAYQYDKRVLEIVQKFAAKPVFRGLQGVQTNGDKMPQSILGLPFDLEPMPMEVPRRSFAKDYAGG